MPSDGPIGAVTTIDFTGNNVYISQNNLGGAGPDTGTEELRFKNVGNFAGQPLDMVFTVLSGYEAYRTDRTMINGKFGQINLRAGRENAEMQLCWEDSSSGEQVSLTEFGLVFHDFDNGGSKDPTKDWCEERLTVHDPASYSTSETDDPPVATQLVTTPLNNGESIRFDSTEAGVGADNAQDPDDLTDLQKSRAVTLTFKQTACVRIDFGIIVITEAEWDYGRNFLFAGATSIEYVCNHIPFIPPSPPSPPSPSPPPLPSPPPPSPPPALPSPCYDSDPYGASDKGGDRCSDYYANDGWCGNYDDSDFTSMTMCCACGGGITEAGSGEPSPPPTLPGGGM